MIRPTRERNKRTFQKYISMKFLVEFQGTLLGFFLDVDLRKLVVGCLPLLIITI